MGCRGQRHHRFPGNFFIIMILLFQIKKPSFPMGTRTEKTFLRYHLVCRKIRPLCTVPTHRLPVNAGIASEDTLEKSISPCPQRPICCPAFRSALSPRNSLWMRIAVLLPLQWFCIRLCFLYYSCVRLSRTNFRHRWTILIFPDNATDDADDLGIGTVNGRIILVFRH